MRRLEKEKIERERETERDREMGEKRVRKLNVRSFFLVIFV